MTEKVDIEILKYYQASLKSYETATDINKYEEATRTIASLNKNGIKVCFHTSICYIIERIVKDFPTPEIIGSLMRAINNYLEGVIVGKNTSRLLEKVLKSCQSKEISDDEIVQFQSKKFCEYMWIHYPDNLENNIGSHIVRLFFQFVCGVYVDAEDKIYYSKKAVVGQPMQENYLEKLNDLIDRFLLTPHLIQLLTNEYMSSTIQILLVICLVRCPEKYEVVAKHVITVLCHTAKRDKKENKEPFHIPESFHDKYQSFFIECMIANLPKGETLKKFIKTYLKQGRSEFIKDILINSNSCAIFKTAVSRISKPDLLLQIAQELKSSLYETTEFVCGNVFLKLLIQLVSKIDLFSPTEGSSFRFYKNYIIEIIQFLSREPSGSVSLHHFLLNGLKDQSDKDKNVDDEDESNASNEKVSSILASMVIQSILDTFSPIPKTITKLFSSLSAPQLCDIADDPRGSHTLDAFFKSPCMRDDVKMQLLDVLSAKDLVRIACSRPGSRVLDTVWATSNVPLIDLVKSKLEDERSDLRSHVIGRFIESKFFGYIPKSYVDKGNKSKTNPSKPNLKRPIKSNNDNGKKWKKNN